jgi:hypothetical protein
MSLEEHEEERRLRTEIRYANVGIQDWWDPVYQKLGTRAPPPVDGEGHYDYRVRMAIQAKKSLPVTNKLSQVGLRNTYRSSPTAFRNLEQSLHKELAVYADSVDSAPANGMRRIEEVNPQNGLKIIKWIGTRPFTDDFLQPGRIAKIRDPSQFPRAFL